MNFHEIIFFMDRYRSYEPHQNQFLPINSGELFPSGSYERFLVDIIQNINERIIDSEEDKGGETPYNPKALLGIIFYSYSNGIFSSRKMETACKNDLRYMYVSGYNTPDHSTISRFMNNHEGCIKDIFAKILYLADENGYVDYKLIATDGSKIKADASKRFSGTLAMFKAREKKLKDKIELAIQKQKSADKAVEKAYWEKKKRIYEDNKEKIVEFLSTAQEMRNFDGHEVQQNITDPDCRRMKAGMKIEESYNSQISVCGKNGLIIAAEVSNDETDVNLFKTMSAEIKKNVPVRSRERLKNSRYLYDNGYYKADNIVEAERSGMDVYIADQRDKDVYHKKEKRSEKIGIDHCKIHRCGRFYSVTCPGGIRLTEYQLWYHKGRTFYTFKVRATHAGRCQSCRIYNQCRGGNKYSNTKCFTIAKTLLDHRDIIERHKRKIRSEKGRKIYSQRISIVEKVFAHIKNNYGFRSFLRRGIKKVKNEWLIACCSYNLKKLHTLETRY
jgi:transposase